MSSFFEELKIKSKSYPENRRELPVAPESWIEHLIGYTARELSQYLYDLREQDNFPEMLATVHKVLTLIPGGASELSIPLLRILFTNDSKANLPTYPEHLDLPSLLLNKKEKGQNFFKSLKFELETANRIDFVVSFVRMSGLQLLIGPLSDLLKRGGSARILTSTYMSITEPKALRKLFEMDGIEVRVDLADAQSFHTKAYLFSRDSNLNTALIGSSNISSAALREGQEWNIRIPDAHYLSIYKESQAQFQLLWGEAAPLSQELVDSYEKHYKSQISKKNGPPPFTFLERGETYEAGLVKSIQPNLMQVRALDELRQTRAQGKRRAAVIAATGTGKTFLAALEVQQFGAKRLLFLAHRNELLVNAKYTFEHVFQPNHVGLCGMLTGEVKEGHARFLFASVQTISRKETLHSFAKDHFDYIIVDEFHHAEAMTYRRVLDYFRPTFLLGLTATPERMDGKDVLAICDQNVVFELRLRDALELDLLAPFHYFGIADDTVDYDEVDEKNGILDTQSLAENLSTRGRVEHILRHIDLYGYHGEQLCALGFCVNINHAQFMSDAFNERNILAACLSGHDDNETRIKTIQALQSPLDPLQVIFTVNIFNEGVDIPAVNMLLFLRPTDSSTVFIQQLGRGLRKFEDKEYVTVLDFIGNYRNSFVVPLALAGETAKTFDKGRLSTKVRNEFSDLPGECYVDLDAITKERILTTLERIKVNSSSWLKRLYFLFRRDLGRAPEILDFLYTEGAPSFSTFVRKYNSWLIVKKRFCDLAGSEEDLLEDPFMMEVVERIEQSIPLKWPYEFAILASAFGRQESSISLDDTTTILAQWFGVSIERKQHESLIIRAMDELSNRHKKQRWAFGHREGKYFKVNEDFLELAQNEFKRGYINDRFVYGSNLFRRQYKAQQFLEKGERLARYQNYTREDLQFLFEDTAAKGSWREGVKRLTQRYFLFINLHKDDSVKEALKYHDYFIDPSTFHWQSQNQTSHESGTGLNFIHHKERGYSLHLFVRRYAKMDGETLPFMYLGEVDYVRSDGDKPMNIVWRLHHPVPDAIFTDYVRG